jgi:succinyl-diaminopimelate desuccinylase
MEDIEMAKSRLEKETGAKIELTPVQFEENTAPTPMESEIVQRLKTALKQLRGLDARPVGIGGGTVGLYFRRKGIHTAVWSTLDDMAHQPNEYCKIDNMVNDAKVFLHVALG